LNEPKDPHWEEIQNIIRQLPNGAQIQDILEGLAHAPPRRTLQYRLQQWVKQGRLQRTGQRRGTRYFLAQNKLVQNKVHSTQIKAATDHFPYGPEAQHIIKSIRQPMLQRQPVGYDFNFLDQYRPNHSSYLSKSERKHLSQLSQHMPEQPAGTFARQLLNRLLIDLSWNSSRLEGNTYSLLDTRRLIQFGAEAEGKAKLEAQMIINHKEAIEFLVESAEEIGFNRYTLLNLHALLANNLLPDPQANGRLRTISVGIGHSTFQPLDVPQLIGTYFDQLLQTAQAIHNPFEQAFFILIQLPYLQPFDDVNKRVSRLAANIPLIKQNLIPLSFTDLPNQVYTESILAVYELNALAPIKDVFIWAYERSAAHYRAARQTLGEPDAFRLKYREELKSLISSIVSQKLDKKLAHAFLAQWVSEHIQMEDQAEFTHKAESELLSLHEGNFARYRIRPQAFKDWQSVWLG